MLAVFFDYSHAHNLTIWTQTGRLSSNTAPSLFWLGIRYFGVLDFSTSQWLHAQVVVDNAIGRRGWSLPMTL